MVNTLFAAGTYCSVYEMLRLKLNNAFQKKALHTLNHQLQELDRLKTQFFQNITHELRTPLSLIIGPVEQMFRNRSSTMSQAEKEQISVIRRNSQQLLGLINQILDLAKLDAGEMKCTIESFKSKAVAGYVFGLFIGKIKDRIMLICRIDP